MSMSRSRLSITARILGTSFNCSSVTGSTVAIFSTVFGRSVNAIALSGLVPDCAVGALLLVNVVSSSMYLITVSVVVSCGIKSATTARCAARSARPAGARVHRRVIAAVVMVVFCSWRKTFPLGSTSSKFTPYNGAETPLCRAYSAAPTKRSPIDFGASSCNATRPARALELALLLRCAKRLDLLFADEAGSFSCATIASSCLPRSVSSSLAWRISLTILSQIVVSAARL